VNDIKWDPTLCFTVDLQLEIILSCALKVKPKMLPNVNMRLGVMLVRDFDLEVLSDRRENRAHIWVAEVHFERMATFLAQIEPQLTGDSA